MITPSDLVPLPVRDSDLNHPQLAIISNHTANTWQPNRPNDEIAADTKLGKIAEHALEVYFQEHGVSYLSWDTIRQDNFETHAPVDGFLMKNETFVQLDRTAFSSQAHAAIESTHFTTQFRDDWEDKGVYGYEVKSTRITDRLQNSDNSLNPSKLLRDDFLVYPSVRYGKLDDSLRRKLLQQFERDAIEGLTPRALFRAYIESRDGIHTVYLIGYIPRHSFFESQKLNVKNMRQLGKSDLAIYYAVPLSEGFPMFNVVKLFGTDPT